MIYTEMKHFFHSIQKIRNDGKKAGFSIIVALFSLIPINGFGQKTCKNPPVVSLSQSSGSACYMNQVSISGNTFGGSATSVRITENGRGTVSPASASSSPFTFTYNPNINDAGNIVTITVTTNNPSGSPCKAAVATFLLTVTSSYPSPVIDSIIQPTCTVSTGSVELSSLPTNANWTITVSPGGMTMGGSGATATIPNLSAGVFTFTVSVADGCISSPSAQAEISDQPPTPSPPVPGIISPPTCTLSTGSVTLSGLPSPGTWTLTRYPGSIKTSGTGPNTTITGLDPGTYNFFSTSSAGCASMLSADVNIPARPPMPNAPVIDTIIQPSLVVPTGSVVLTGLPATGIWTIIRSPGEVTSTGSGTSITIAGLETGTYTFRVRNTSGCLSAASSPATISPPLLPEVIITDPPPVCFPATIDLTAPEIKEGSTSGLTYTYWTNSQATAALENPTAAGNGIYYIKGTAASGYSDIKPVTVTVSQSPSANAGPDQVISNNFNSILEAELGAEESGIWHSDSDTIVFDDPADPHSTVSNLAAGENELSWIVTNGVCPADTDKVIITVGDLIIPTLITPNGDSKNEYFVIQGIENSSHTELTVFDRRGILVFQDSKYDNRWNGVDYNNKPLINDTYFFVLKLLNGKSYRGYIVIRK
jgi:gliding motility-associated-like protein